MAYTHQRFSLGFNGNQIVIANLTAEKKVPVPVGGGELTFSYSVEWHGSFAHAVRSARNKCIPRECKTGEASPGSTQSE
ncbi:Transmembrane 9 superfamily member 1 [Diplonema papillatum]|nr:Transmembrane 9 superfamily member 1 [Diplonema papillatum]